MAVPEIPVYIQIALFPFLVQHSVQQVQQLASYCFEDQIRVCDLQFLAVKTSAATGIIKEEIDLPECIHGN